MEKFKIIEAEPELLTDLIFVENEKVMGQVYCKYLNLYYSQFSGKISQGADDLISETLQLFQEFHSK